MISKWRCLYVTSISGWDELQLRGERLDVINSIRLIPRPPLPQPKPNWRPRLYFLSLRRPKTKTSISGTVLRKTIKYNLQLRGERHRRWKQRSPPISDDEWTTAFTTTGDSCIGIERLTYDCAPTDSRMEVGRSHGPCLWLLFVLVTRRRNRTYADFRYRPYRQTERSLNVTTVGLLSLQAMTHAAAQRRHLPPTFTSSCWQIGHSTPTVRSVDIVVYHIRQVAANWK